MNSDYEENHVNPMNLVAGQEVTSGPADKAWPGWIWVTDSGGRSGYVPASQLEPLGEDRWAAIADFDSTVLKVSRGDVVESVREVHGWHWCKSEGGKEGWVANYLLKGAGAGDES